MIFVIKLLLLIGIKMWLRLECCWMSFIVMVFCFVIMVGVLNGWIKVIFNFFESLSVLVLVLLKLVL